MFNRTESSPFRRDPLQEMRVVKWCTRLIVYPLVALMVPSTHLVFGTPWLQGFIIHLGGGWLIATIGVEFGFFYAFKLRKEAAYPTMLAMELGPVHDLDKACQKGVETVATWLGAQAAVLVCLHRDGEGFEATGAYNLPPDWREKVRQASLDLQPFREAIVRQQVLVGPVKKTDAWSFFYNGDYLAAYVPVVSLDTPIGVLSLLGDKGASDLKDRVLLTAVGMVMGLALDNVRLYDHEYQAVLRILCEALDVRDQATEGHSRRVAALSLTVAKEMGLSGEALKDLERAAILHDIGKIVVADAILSKPGPLTEAEWEEMKRHPVLGYDMVRNVPLLRHAAEIIYAHHERFDGGGYPKRLKSDEIPLGARIFAVVDAYDAITSDRPYRQARLHEYALDEIKRNTGTQFDPKVVEAFLRAAEKGLISGDGSSPASAKPLSLGTTVRAALPPV
ncbi:MAG: HD-GYP domain-containing protein [Dehalococcoidia bacterium]